MHPPHRAQLQFIVAEVTGMAIGKKVKIQVIISQHTEMMLTASPYLPMCHGPSRTGRLVARLHANKAIGMPYEPKKHAIVSDTIALKATVEPMLIRPSSSEITDDKAIDQSGRCVVGWTNDS